MFSQHHADLIMLALWHTWSSCNVVPSALFFSVNISLIVWGVLVFMRILGLFFQFLYKTFIVIVIVIVLNL
jgi:hypothetical protein